MCLFEGMAVADSTAASSGSESAHIRQQDGCGGMHGRGRDSISEWSGVELSRGVEVLTDTVATAGGDSDTSMACSTVQRDDGQEPDRRAIVGGGGCEEEAVSVLMVIVI